MRTINAFACHVTHVLVKKYRPTRGDEAWMFIVSQQSKVKLILSVLPYFVGYRIFQSCSFRSRIVESSVLSSDLEGRCCRL